MNEHSPGQGVEATWPGLLWRLALASGAGILLFVAMQLFVSRLGLSQASSWSLLPPLVAYPFVSGVCASLVSLALLPQRASYSARSLKMLTALTWPPAIFGFIFAPMLYYMFARHSLPYADTISIAIAAIGWIILASWCLRGPGLTDPPAKRMAVRRERGVRMAKLSPVVALVIALIMVFWPVYSGFSSSTGGTGDASIVQTAATLLAEDGITILIYAALLVAMSLMLTAGAVRENRALIWAPTLALLIFAVAGAFTIGVFIIIPALWMFASALMLTGHNRRFQL